MTKGNSIDMLAALWAAVTCLKEEGSTEQRKCKQLSDYWPIKRAKVTTNVVMGEMSALMHRWEGRKETHAHSVNHQYTRNLLH